MNYVRILVSVSIIILLSCFGSRLVYAVETTSKELNWLHSLSMKELMQVTIVSKHEEDILRTPMSAAVVTAEQISNAGATSIPEAIRLLPGVLVLEQTPGNFEVYVRGLGNLAPRQFITHSLNTQTLVMIDNRIVYNYWQGGTFWENLPIGLHDVGRIEVLRGPAAALYGPNAVSGAINIITRDADTETFSPRIHVEAGTDNASIVRAAIDFSNTQLKTQLSVHQEKRDRQQTEIWQYLTESTVDRDDLISVNFPGPPNLDFNRAVITDDELALNRYGVNGFFAYTSEANATVDITLGYQDAESTKVHLDNGRTPLSYVQDDSWYIDVQYEKQGLKSMLSYLDGSHDVPGLANTGTFDYENFDFSTEYEYNYGDAILRSGISYRRARQNGEFLGEGVEDKYLATSAVFFSGDYSFSGFRVVGAVRADNYNVPDRTVVGYNAALTYTLSEHHVFRLASGHAHRAPFFMQTYLDTVSAPDPSIFFRGDKDMELVKLDSIEVGYRGWFSETLLIDWVAFRNSSDGYGVLEPINIADGPFSSSLYQEQDLRVIQYGTTISVTWQLSEALTANIFQTIQHTKLRSLDSFLQSPTYNSDRETDKFMPRYFGGFSVNYRASSKWNINVSGSNWSSRTLVHFNGDYEGPSRFLLNTKVSCFLYKNTQIFFNARSLSSGGRQEFPGADEIGATAFLGIDVKF